MNVHCRFCRDLTGSHREPVALRRRELSRPPDQIRRQKMVVMSRRTQLRLRFATDPSLKYMLPFVTIVSLSSALVAAQQVKSFYSGPIGSYSTEYSLGGPRYEPYQEQQQVAYAYRPARTDRRFEPVVTVRGVPAGASAAVPAVPSVSATPAFSAPISRSRYFPVAPTASVRPNTGVFRPAIANVAVPAYPVSAGVRDANSVRVVSGVEDRVSYPPTPYAFEYSVDSAEGGHSRTERGDGAGRVTGSYTIQLTDGRSRVVEYVADEGGYRANIRTNEFGTESQNPADIVLQSSAIPAREAVLLGERDTNFRQYGPSHHKKA
ncbi:cuticle protein 10.9-like [Tropilaelaps mercedesae]|uniref:Cuticle protein 10.9-like n=1 Tax=Tropilaelaps mercedesae TaxID=418985 RepID=A0A1V9WYX9_9ACAR|nr:cuticle protein 10.9-like [Tropilaelaps mercedesae]